MTRHRSMARMVRFGMYVSLVGLVLSMLAPATPLPSFLAPQVAQAEVPNFTTLRPVGPGFLFTSSIAVGDLDGDGDLDLALGQDNLGNASFTGGIYFNDGAGNFPLSPDTAFGRPQDRTTSLALGDLDGDGDLDLVASNEGAPNDVYLNDGHGRMTLIAQLGAANNNTQSVALGDLDSDGDLDLATGNLFQPNAVYFNNGVGDFVAPITYGSQANATRAVAIADLDGDGRLDIVNGNVGVNLVYFNLATEPGTASFFTGPRDCNALFQVWCFGNGLEITEELTIGDVNGDSRPDVISGNRGPNTVYLGTGARLLVYGGDLGLASETTTTVALGDLDNDGDLDLVSGNLNQPSFVYTNNGSGGFSTVISLDPNNSRAFTTAVAIADLNADGRLDIVVGNNQQQSVIYLADRGGDLVSREEIGRGGGLTNWIGSADLNSDGVADVVELNAGQANRVYLSGPNGVLDTGTPFGTGYDRSQHGAIADFNGDGALDIAVANHDDQNPIYYNNGAGGFHRGPILCGVTIGVRCLTDNKASVSSFGVGDLDGNGAPDLVLGGVSAGTILLFDSAGNQIGQRSFGTLNSPSGRVAVADMDADGDLDLVAGQVGRSAIYFNDGAANFGAPPLPFGLFSDQQPLIDVADLNADNRPDIVFSIYGNIQVLLNAGGTLIDTGLLFRLDPRDILGLAVGDLNGDGTPEIAITEDGRPITVYWNAGNGSFPTRAELPVGTNFSRALAVGDLNSDGANDLLVGNFGQQNVALINAGDGTLSETVLLGEQPDRIFALAPGDLNRDGALDLVALRNGAQGAIFFNAGAGSFPRATSVPFGPISANPSTVVVGDLDNDGDLDLVSAYYDRPIAVTRNDADTYTQFVELDVPVGPYTDLALADFDNDGDLDLISVLRGGQAGVHWNDGTGAFRAPQPVGPADALSNSVAVGDLNGDNSVDLVIVNSIGQPNQVYLNSGDGTFATAGMFGSSSESGNKVALGDMDGDGDLDAVVGNVGVQSALYLNDGAGRFGPPRPLVIRTALSTPSGLALTDLNNDGALDIVLGKYGQTSEAYLNDGAGQFPISWSFGTGGTTTDSVAGDLDGDGDHDVVLAGFVQPTAIFRNGRANAARLPNNPPTIALNYPGPGPAAPPFAGTARLETQLIPITYRLADPEGDQVRRVRARYSLDGGGTWRPAVPTADTDLSDLSAPPEGAEHTFVWDTFASGFFGQSDLVLIEIAAESDFRPRIGTTPGPFQRPAAVAATLPFRVRGTQVRVLTNTATPADGALVYRLPAGQARGAAPLADSGNTPLRTDQNGFLPGRNVLKVGTGGDRLVALQPVVITDTYTLYHTSAPVSATGLELAPLRTPGLQTLTVSADRPLMLFNLDVALEWDARKDRQFMARLTDDMQRASEILYDWSDGQIALGNVTIFHDAKTVRYDDGWDLWNYAHVRVYATNRLRPNANKGGIVTEPQADPTIADVTYDPGQIRIGAVWNRYGEASGTLGEDWPRTLAHELGHYLFALDENYLGLNEAGILVPVQGCRGGMADPYRDDYSEFHPRDADWQERCQDTLSEQVNQRSDWESILAFYPDAGFQAPNAFNAQSGPTVLPLGVTHIVEADLSAPPTTLDVPLISLEQDAAAVQPGADARAFLFHDESVTDLGRPVLDRVEARGAAPGDRLCVFEPAARRLGCETLQIGDQTLDLQTDDTWQPALTLTPVTSRTLSIDVRNIPPGQTLTAQLYPVDAPRSPVITLRADGAGYSGVFGPNLLSEPVFEGFVHLVLEGADNREAMIDFALGGNPGRRWSRTAPRGNPGRRWSRTAPRGNPGRRWSRTAPLISSDGQVILFTDQEFNEGEFYTFQTVATLPEQPTWATPVGQAYRLTATAQAPALTTASISFGYLQREVPAGQERWLTVYFNDGTGWVALPTTLNEEYNIAATAVRGPGIYALMSSIEVTLRNPGWNFMRYPGVDKQPVADAVRGLAARLSAGSPFIVYHDAGAAATPRWRLYTPTGPAYVNSLATLEFDQDYYVWVPQATRFPVRSGAMLAGAFAQPPATFYGAVAAHPEKPLEPGMPVIARIGTTICGAGEVQRSDGTLVYVVSVEAAGTRPGCGTAGATVHFSIAGHVMGGTGVWDDSRVQQLDLTAIGAATEYQIYLPITQK